MLSTSMMPVRTPGIPRAPSLYEKGISFLSALRGPGQIFSPVSSVTLKFTPRLNLTITNGGGPRTYPGGVSKWQWKRMQAKKAKQLLKARLCRERQIYEMRKRAELKAAISELERPWEVVEKAPNLFSVKADEQVKVLADRFQKPGGFDMWSERDGPQVFKTPDGLPTARFFPKNAVHSVKPYGVMVDVSDSARPTSLDKDGRSRTSKRAVLNNKEGTVEEGSTSFANSKQGRVTKTGVDIHRRSRRGSYENNDNAFSDESPYRSSSLNQDTVKSYGMIDPSDSARPTFLEKEVSSYNDWTTRGNYERSSISKRDVPNNKGGMIEKGSSRNFVNSKHGKVAKNGVDVHRMPHRGSYEIYGNAFSDESPYRSSSLNQETSRPVSRQAAKWNSSDHSTQRLPPVKDYKRSSTSLQSRRKLDLRYAYTVGSDDDSIDYDSGSAPSS